MLCLLPARRPFALRRFAIALSLIVLATASASAQMTVNPPPSSDGSADHLWSGAVSTDWNTDGNWETGGVPASDSRVYIVPGDNACVVNTSIMPPGGTGAFDALLVTGGYGTANNYPLRLLGDGRLVAFDTFIGTNGDSQMLIDEGGRLLGSTLVIGGDINDSAATANSGFVKVYGTLECQMAYVGNTGTGELTMEAGSTLSTMGNVLGYAADSFGTMNLNGLTGANPDDTSYAGQFIVGREGSGTLNVTDATLGNASTSTILALGAEASGTGTLVVNNGVLAPGLLTIGANGTGTATVRNGSTLDITGAAYGVTLGEISGSQGVLTLTGSGTTASDGIFVVGKAGSGLLEVTSGAVLGNTRNQSHIQLAASTGASGELMVDGGTVRNALIYVGQGGASADAVFRNGATLDGATMLLGDGGTTGTLSFENSTWSSDASNSLLVIGMTNGSASAIISGGSTVNIDGSQSSGTGAVGLGGANGSQALLHVRDASTTLTARTLRLGGSSSNSMAELRIYDDASVTVTEAFQLWHTTGATPHAIEVSQGGSLSASGGLHFADSGTPTDIDILSGGQVTLHQSEDAPSILQNVDLTIDGLGSELRFEKMATNSSPLGMGTIPVTVSGGGLLNVSELYAMNSNITVTGDNSVFRSDSDLTITANDNVDNFTVSNGGILAAERIFLANDYPKVDRAGVHLVTGQGTLVETGHLSVAGGGDELSRLKIADGASVVAVDGSIGSGVISGDAMGEVLINGSGSELIFTNTLDVGRFYREDHAYSLDQAGRGHLRIKDGALVEAKTVSLEYATPTTPLVRMGTINLNGGELRMETLNDDLSDPGLNWMAGTLHFTDSTALSSASSWEDHLTLSADQTLVTDDRLTINSGGSLTVAGGSADVTGLTNFKASPIDLQYGSVRIHDGYLRWNTLPQTMPFTSLHVDGSAGQLASLTFDNVALDPQQKPFLDATIGQSGNALWTLSNGTDFALVSSLTVGPGGAVKVDQATLTAPILLGSGQIELTDPAAGPALTVNGGAYSGSITGSGSLQKNSSNTLTLSGPLSYTGETIIDGGTLAFDSDLTGTGGGVLIGSGGNLLVDNANLGGHAVSGTGRINLDGHATLGDSSTNAGFNFDGTLFVYDKTLQLEDKNRAVLGRTVNIGGGTIDAVNGVRLGPVHSLDTSYVLNATGSCHIDAEFRHNGMAHGPTDTEWLILTNAVSGAGSFDGNVAFLGSYSPGNSPAVVDVENVMFSADNILTMEIGGLLAGTDYDQLNVSGLATLGGTLELVMLDGYTLEPGEIYNLIDGPISGEFHAVTGLPDGWNLSYDATGVTVTPEPATLGLLGLGGLALLRRRSR